MAKLNMGSDNLINEGTNGTSQSSDEISSPVVKAIASHVGRFYPAPQACLNTYSLDNSNDKTFVEKVSSVNNSSEIVFHGVESHAPAGFNNPFFKKEAEV